MEGVSTMRHEVWTPSGDSDSGEWLALVDVVPGGTRVLAMDGKSDPGWVRVTEVDRGFEAVVEIASGVSEPAGAQAVLQCTPRTRVLTADGPARAEAHVCLSERELVPVSQLSVERWGAYVLMRFCGDETPAMSVWVGVGQKDYDSD